MFGLFKRKNVKKDENSVAFRREMAAKLDGRHIKYATERIDNVDIIIGREGSITLRDGKLILFSSADIVFRCEIDELKASELLSLDGAILTGPDLEHGGQLRTVIAYYTYYR